MSNAWYLITVPNMNKITTFFSEISQVLKSYEKIAIITQIWHRAKFYFTCINGPWYLIMVRNMKKIHLAIMGECMRTDRRLDWWTGPVPIFPNSDLAEWGIIAGVLWHTKYWILKNLVTFLSVWGVPDKTPSQSHHRAVTKLSILSWQHPPPPHPWKANDKIFCTVIWYLCENYDSFVMPSSHLHNNGQD